MPLGMEVSLGPVLDVYPARPRMGASQFSANVYCGQTVGWITMPLNMEVGLGPENSVLDGA